MFQNFRFFINFYFNLRLNIFCFKFWLIFLVSWLKTHRFYLKHWRRSFYYAFFLRKSCWNFVAFCWDRSHLSFWGWKIITQLLLALSFALPKFRQVYWPFTSLIFRNLIKDNFLRWSNRAYSCIFALTKKLWTFLNTLFENFSLLFLLL